MSREVCGICWCPYDEDTGACACAPQSPPQRKPLTEEEIMQCFVEAVADYVDVSDAEMVDFARAVERAHGIGGEA